MQHQIRRARGPMLLAIWAIILNIIANFLTDGLKKLDGAPNWLTGNEQYVFMFSLLAILIVAYVLSSPKSPSRHETDQRSDEQRKFAETENALRDGIASRAAQILALQKNCDLYRQEGSRLKAQLQESITERDALAEREQKAKVTNDGRISAANQRMRDAELERDKLRVDLTNLTMRFDNLKPLADWAERMIERETKYPLFDHPMVKCHIARRQHLDDKQPYIDIILEIPYRGVQRLVIDDFSGNFSWHDSVFAHDPRPVADAFGQGDLPFDHEGPTTAYICFRQYVFGREEEIKEHLEKATEMWLQTNGMTLMVRVLAVADGRPLYERNIFGSELTAQVPRG